MKRVIADSVWNPAYFVERVIRATPDPWQAETMASLVKQKRAAVAGGNGVGKDTLASWLALWVLCTRRYSKGQITGPGIRQVQDVIWAELKKWIDNSPYLHHLLDWQKTHIRVRESPERWFLSARTAAKRYSHSTGEAAAEGIQGMHEEHLIIAITEASGVEDLNWAAAESCCTRPDNYLLAVGNPLRRSGIFYEVFNKPQYEDWARRHVSYLEASHVDRALIEGWIKRYGAESAYCQVRCFGQFPKEGAQDAALPWDLVMRAMEREVSGDGSGDLQIGVDCARYGSDESIVAIRKGYAVKEVRAYQKTSGPQLVGYVIRGVEDYGGDQDTLICVDETGLGGSGVVDPLRQVHGYRRVAGVNNASPPLRFPNRFECWDDEAWMENFVAWCETGTLPMDEVLLAQLTTRRYEFTGKTGQQRRLESKDRMRQRGLPSPDRAEAVVMACVEPPAASVVLPFRI